MSLDWEKWGESVRDSIDEAIGSGDFGDLNRNIRKTVDQAVKSVRSVDQRFQSRTDYTYRYVKQTSSTHVVSKKKRSELYQRTGTRTLGGAALTGFGGILLVPSLLFAMGGLLAEGLTGLAFGLGTTLPLWASGIVLLYVGMNKLGLAGRYKRYVQVINDRTYCDLKELEERTGWKRKKIVRDIRKLIQKGWFKEGHLDQEETCLMVTDQTYQEYVRIQDQRKEIAAEEERLKKEMEEKKAKAENQTEAERIIEEGNQYVQMIRQCNDAIPGEEISQKIARIEELVRKIFDRVRQNPGMVDEIRKMMEYYLPTTIKLLKAYEELDGQPVEGENIRQSKREIEETLDTLNEAFERLLDSLFEKVAWDVSSDISVLEAVLAQDGLTGNEIKRKG